MADYTQYLKETAYFDYSHPAIQSLVDDLNGINPQQKLLDAYYRIRDNIAYNPYTFTEGESALKASFAAQSDSAYCIPKSALMVAVSRSLGIPARIGLADVRNHLSSPKLLEWLGTDLFVMHGYAELYIDNQWVKCTPVFNLSLCEKFGIKPLEFDGKQDSIFHAFTHGGQQHMEYVNEHGTFADMPVAKIFDTVATAYPHIDLTSMSNTGQRLELEID